MAREVHGSVPNPGGSRNEKGSPLKWIGSFLFWKRVAMAGLLGRGGVFGTEKDPRRPTKIPNWDEGGCERGGFHS